MSKFVGQTVQAPVGSPVTPVGVVVAGVISGEVPRPPAIGIPSVVATSRSTIDRSRLRGIPGSCVPWLKALIE